MSRCVSWSPCHLIHSTQIFVALLQLGPLRNLKYLSSRKWRELSKICHYAKWLFSLLVNLPIISFINRSVYKMSFSPTNSPNCRYTVQYNIRNRKTGNFHILIGWKQQISLSELFRTIFHYENSSFFCE